MEYHSEKGNINFVWQKIIYPLQREDQTKLERTLQYQCHKHTEAEEREKSCENEEMKKEKKREREVFKKRKGGR